MDTQCFVDGEVVDWEAGLDDEVGSDIAALVVFHPEGMSKRSFERSCDRMEDRLEARTALALNLAANQGRRFGLIDSRLMERVDDAMSEEFGADELNKFLTDTQMVAMDLIGGAFARIAALGVRITPATVIAAVEIRPARSFTTEKKLAAYLQAGKQNWKPAVRLSLNVSLDGPQLDVEASGYILRSTLSDSWPITEWRQKVRPTGEKREAAASLRLVAG